MPQNSNISNSSSNISISSQNVGKILAVANFKIAFSQVLVCIFFYINCTMLFTFLRKHSFHQDTRYILFAHMLMVDTLQLLFMDLGVTLAYFFIVAPAGACILFCMIMASLTYFTTLTLTFMCLERYVAICMPLRHAVIATVKRTLYAILIIWLIGSIPSFKELFIIVAIETVTFYSQRFICAYDMMIRSKWQSDLMSGVALSYFFLMSIIVLFTYLKMMQAARSASADKMLVTKARHTVVLHAFQLLLSLITLVCPFVEMTVLQVDIQVFSNLRYFNFVVFSLFPRCLSPLIYGIRDEKFNSVFQQYVFCGLGLKQMTQNLIQSK
ncbi:odorant receptor 131-2-like [Erpetoichthys calabaricus]|uniref:odorant receptor 131-2-like n=1 Tax=Erpetoichthys calabaricus TaxID=27687 RepID=UPI0022340BE5|nr:odorant receptor 131-2-like [Erpetoichthys calabaricus]